MTSIRANILNGRPAPSEHDALPVARIGTVQPYGVMMVVAPDTGLVEHVSANVEEILGVPARSLLGNRPTLAFPTAELSTRIEEILRPGRRYFDNPTPLTAKGKKFEAVCHLRDGWLFIEIEPYVEAEHDYATMVTAALDAIAKQTSVQGLYAAATSMMHFVTCWDRVKLYKFVSHGHGVVVAEQHAPNSKLPDSFLGYHFSASDVPESAKEILLTGKSRQKPTQNASVPLLTLGRDGQVTGSGTSVDMTDCWLRGIHPCDNGYNRNLGVASNIIFPVCLDATLWGLFVVHNHDEAFLNYDTRVVIEQLTMMFISRLVELEANEARIDERHRLGVQMLGPIEDGQALVTDIAAGCAAQDSAVRMQAVLAVSHYLAALAPTYVSANGTDSSVPGRAEDKFAIDLLRLADADGAAVLRSGPGAHVHLIGATPDAMVVRGIAGLFGNRLPGFDSSGWPVFATDALGDYAPIGAQAREIASGLLATPICDRGDMILWFRRERVVDAVWAGPQPSEAELNSEAMFRSRSDFSAHHAPLAGASRPWLEAEVLLAAQFAAKLGEIWLRCQDGSRAAGYASGSLAQAPAAAASPAPSEAVAEPTNLRLAGIFADATAAPAPARRAVGRSRSSFNG